MPGQVDLPSVGAEEQQDSPLPLNEPSVVGVETSPLDDRVILLSEGQMPRHTPSALPATAAPEERW